MSVATAPPIQTHSKLIKWGLAIAGVAIAAYVVGYFVTKGSSKASKNGSRNSNANFK